MKLWEHPHGQWPPFHTAALTPLSAPCNKPATSSGSPDHAYKLCWLTNSRAVGAPNETWPLQAVDSIQHSLLTSKGVSIITILFGHMATLLSTHQRSAGRPYPAQPCDLPLTATELAPSCFQPQLHSAVLRRASPTSSPSSTVNWSTLLV